MGPFCATVQQSTCVLTGQRPNGVTGYARIDGTPEVLAGILAVLGLAVLGQFVVASARRRRRDFAVLKPSGCCAAQLSAVTAWQVTTLTGLALLVGLPLGVAAGHWAWGLFAAEPQASRPALSRRYRWSCSCSSSHPRREPWRSGLVGSARLSPADVLRAE